MSGVISIKGNNTKALVQNVSSLPRDISQDKVMAYYKLYSLSITKQWDQLVYQLSQLSLLEDSRILGLIIDCELPISKKIQVLDKALSRLPDEADLLYVRSYLAAQSGESPLDTATPLPPSIKGRTSLPEIIIGFKFFNIRIYRAFPVF